MTKSNTLPFHSQKGLSHKVCKIPAWSHDLKKLSGRAGWSIHTP